MIAKKHILSAFNELLLKADERTTHEINEAIRLLKLSEAVDIKIMCSSDQENCYLITLNSFNNEISYPLA